MSSKVVRAIDVGYGNTKFTLFHAPGQPVGCDFFPSIAPQATDGPSLATDMIRKRDTVVIEVDGVRYEVGKDANLARDSSYGRILDPEYSLSDTYIALVRGALSYMAVDEIDLLMLGLPVNTFDKYNSELAHRMRGVHVVLDAEGRRKEVLVKDARVLPQPIGGFLDYALSNKMLGRMRDEMNLVIDPGFYTLDWVVAQGLKMITARSGAHSGGMSAILGSMAEAIGREIDTQITDLTAIDKAIRTGTNPRFFGKEFEIGRFIDIGKAKAHQFAAVLANRVGAGVDIDNIILVGGGAKFFRDIIQEKFPKHELIITVEPEYANVRGFQYAGTDIVNRQRFNDQRGAA